MHLIIHSVVTLLSGLLRPPIETPDKRVVAPGAGSPAGVCRLSLLPLPRPGEPLAPGADAAPSHRLRSNGIASLAEGAIAISMENLPRCIFISTNDASSCRLVLIPPVHCTPL